MQAQLFAPPGTQIDTMSPRAGMLLHPLFAALWFIVIMAPADSFQFSPGILHASSRSHMRTPFLSAPRSSALRVRGPAARGAASSLLMLEPSSSVGARGQSRELAPQESALALTQPRQGSMVSKVGASRWIKSIFKLAMLSFASMLLSTAAMAASTAAEASSGGFVGGLKRALHFVLHLDSEMQAIVAKYGTATYSILWGIASSSLPSSLATRFSSLAEYPPSSLLYFFALSGSDNLASARPGALRPRSSQHLDYYPCLPHCRYHRFPLPTSRFPPLA
eukprot:3332203-Rhodomonas_salina.4